MKELSCGPPLAQVTTEAASFPGLAVLHEPEPALARTKRRHDAGRKRDAPGAAIAAAAGTIPTNRSRVPPNISSGTTSKSGAPEMLEWNRGAGAPRSGESLGDPSAKWGFVGDSGAAGFKHPRTPILPK